MSGRVCSCGLNLDIWQNPWNHEAGCAMDAAPRPAGQDTGHRQTAAEVEAAWLAARGHRTLTEVIAAALAAADRDGYQRGREEMAREVWALADEFAGLASLSDPAFHASYVSTRIRALADRNDEKEGQ